MTKKLLAIGAIVTALPLFAGCGLGFGGDSDTKADPNVQRVSEGRISIEVPNDWTKNDNFKPTLNGFTAVYAGGERDSDLVRLSSDQGQGPDAEATMGYFEMNAQFRTTHGAEFEMGESSYLEIENADQAKMTLWTTQDKSGVKVHGAWVFVSSDDSPSAAGVEIISLNLNHDEVKKMAETIQFDPEAG